MAKTQSSELPGTFPVLSMKSTIICPKCKKEMFWEPQKDKVLVQCVNREMTSWIGNPLEPQRAVALYGQTDGSGCWYETYWVDGPDRLPLWRCGAIFWVRKKPFRKPRV